MYSFEQVLELFDQDEVVVRSAIDLYVAQYGGSNKPPYEDEMVGRLDDFFAIAKKSQKLAIGGSNKLKLSQEDAIKAENILGTQGVALLASSHAIREGRAIARLTENLWQQSYNSERNLINQELIENWENETQWLEDFSENQEAHKKLLKRLGVEREERDFNSLIEIAFGKAKKSVPRPQRNKPPIWEDLIG
jgi:hypothetical protein